MLGYAHNECNLIYKFKKDTVHNDYLINIFGHNSQNFDQSFLIRALQNLYNKFLFHVYQEIQINSYQYKLVHLFLKIAIYF